MMEPIVIEAHRRHANAVAFASSGSILCSAGADAVIKFWSVPNFRPVGTALGHEGSVTSISQHPDGHRLASSSSDGTTRIWEISSGRLLHTINNQKLPRWTRDGRLLSTIAATGGINHWDGSDFSHLALIPVPDRYLFTFEFPPHEDEILVGGTGIIYRLRLHDGAPLGSLPGHGVAVQSLAISPNGKLLASTGAEGSVRLWDTASWALVRDVPLRATGSLAVVWAHSGDTLAVAGDQAITFLPLDSELPNRRIWVGGQGVLGLACSHDGNWLATACADGKVRVWDLTT